MKVGVGVGIGIGVRVGVVMVLVLGLSLPGRIHIPSLAFKRFPGRRVRD